MWCLGRLGNKCVEIVGVIYLHSVLLLPARMCVRGLCEFVFLRLLLPHNVARQSQPPNLLRFLTILHILPSGLGESFYIFSHSVPAVNRGVRMQHMNYLCCVWLLYQNGQDGETILCSEGLRNDFWRERSFRRWRRGSHFCRFSVTWGRRGRRVRPSASKKGPWAALSSLW